MGKFWPIWLTITTAASIFMASAVGRVPVASPVKPSFPAWPHVTTARVAVALTLIAVFLVLYIAILLVWEDFSYYDNEYFTLFTLKGHDYPLQNWRSTGRFTPLGLQEFNLVRHFTDTNTGYHLLPIVQLLIFFYILLILDAELSIGARTFLAIVALLTPSILTSFSGLIFQERDVLFFLACLVLSVMRFEQTRSIAWGVAAVISAQMMIYYKETAFLLLFGFAIGRLILRNRDGYRTKGDLENRLDVCLTFLVASFLLCYFAAMHLQPNLNYATKAQIPRVALAIGYLRLDALTWLFTAVVLGRIYLIVRRRVVPSLLWDGLALGGVACFFSYIYLAIFGLYYMAGVDLIAILYVGRFAVLLWNKLRSWGKIAVMLLGFIVLFQNVLVSAFAVIERKNIIHAKAAIASAVEIQYSRGVENHLRLFFPFSDPYVIMEFAAYLNYRGIPVEGTVDETLGLKSVSLATPKAVAKGGACVEWTSIKCQAANEGPAPGDLVMVFPEDEASFEEARVYREEGELLLSYEPYPRIPRWMHALFASFYMGPETRYRQHTIPDRWMYASVTLRK